MPAYSLGTAERSRVANVMPIQRPPEPRPTSVRAAKYTPRSSLQTNPRHPRATTASEAASTARVRPRRNFGPASAKPTSMPAENVATRPPITAGPAPAASADRGQGRRDHAVAGGVERGERKDGRRRGPPAFSTCHQIVTPARTNPGDDALSVHARRDRKDLPGRRKAPQPELSWLDFNARVLELKGGRVRSAARTGQVLLHLLVEPGRVLHGARCRPPRAGGAGIAVRSADGRRRRRR